MDLSNVSVVSPTYASWHNAAEIVDVRPESNSNRRENYYTDAWVYLDMAWVYATSIFSLFEFLIRRYIATQYARIIHRWLNEIVFDPTANLAKLAVNTTGPPILRESHQMQGQEEVLTRIPFVPTSSDMRTSIVVNFKVYLYFAGHYQIPTNTMQILTHGKISLGQH